MTKYSPLDTFHFAWKHYGSHFKGTLRDLHNTNEFTDVTLVCDDQTQLPVHKLVLSACSPVLGNILLDHPFSHSIIYMSGVKKHEMLSILQFMYLGEAFIQHDQINEFLDVAIGLQVKGISRECSGLDKFENDTKDVECISDTNKDVKDVVSIKQEVLITCDSDPLELEGENSIWGENSGEVVYSCDQCDYKATTNVDFRKHHQTHTRVRYYCDQCEYHTGWKKDLKKHQQCKHEGVRVSCNLCEYVAYDKGMLRKHHQIKHEGIRYSCNQCEYQATRKPDLKRHIKSKHEGFRYPCDECDYQATQVWSLQYHKQSKHPPTDRLLNLH